MALTSRLFAGDRKLEAAATSNAAHIQTGAVGEHVAKIQQALTALDGLAIDAGEMEAKRYGPSTANGVLSYKKKRNIINRSYQSQADNIVGIMTMAALDKEMLEREKTTRITVDGIRCAIATGRRGFPT
jgi:conjugal transfer/entry exclusion protein